jgi:hypothetical protein
VKWAWTIALAGLLAGCAGGDYSPLQRDLAELAEMPKRLDNFVKEKTARPTQTAQADLPPMPDLPVEAAPGEGVGEMAVAETPPVDAPQHDVPSATAVAAPATPAPRAPNLFERIKMASAAQKQQQAPAVPPGPLDQIQEPIPVDNPLARPPWEALAEAGPNADNELDLELLYGAGNVPAELQAEQPAEQQVAVAQPDAPLAMPPEEEAPPVAENEKPAEPAKPPSPNDVVIKSVAVPNVTGAKGKGNAELTAAMRKALKEAGWPVSTAPRKDAMTIQGRVVIGKPHGENQSVKIVWDVLTPDGKRLGDLKQDNAVPAGSLDQAWGESAGYAADAAAEGIFKLIQKYR